MERIVKKIVCLLNSADRVVDYQDNHPHFKTEALAGRMYILENALEDFEEGDLEELCILYDEKKNVGFGYSLKFKEEHPPAHMIERKYK